MGGQAREQNLQLLRATAQLQAVLNLHEQDSAEAKESVNDLLQMLLQARELCAGMKQTMEETESCFRKNPFPTFS